MTKTRRDEKEPGVAANNAAQVSNTQSSAEEQKNNNPQSSNAAGENKTVSKQEQGKNSEVADNTKHSIPDILTDDTAQIFVLLENANQTPRQLKALLDTVDTRIELIEKIQSDQSEKSKRIPGIDRRIETLVLFDNQIETGDRYMSDINKIRLRTELTNLREKRFLVWQKFAKVYGSEMKALQYQHLRAKAQSKLYHSKSSYFVKQRIQKILNTIIKNDKPALEEVKMLSEVKNDDDVKLFNERMRDLLYEYDEENVVLFLHVNRDLYFNIMRLTLVKWNPETDLEITELVIPNESE